MILILGYRTPNQDEIPTILYLGNDGVEAERIAETDPHPRIAMLNHPIVRSLKHWDEQAAAAFEARNSTPPQPPAPAVETSTAGAPAPVAASATAPAEAGAEAEEAPAAHGEESLAEADPNPNPKRRR
jgi:hypothetical protein